MERASMWIRVLSTGAGLGVSAVGAAVALAHVHEPDQRAVVIALSAGVAVVAVVLPALWARPAYAALAVIGMLAGEGFNFAQSVERILSVREERSRMIAADNQPRVVLSERVARVRLELADARKAESEERAKGGCGKVCRDLAAETKRVREDLEKAERELGQLPPPKTESRLAAKLGIQPDLVDIGLAGLVSLALLAMQISLLSLGHAPHPRKDDEAADAPPAKATVPAKPNGPVTRESALTDLVMILAAGSQIPEQRILAARWGVTPGCVSKWLADFEHRGLIDRPRDGKARMVLMAS